MTPAVPIGFGADTKDFRYDGQAAPEPPVFVYGGTYSEWHGARVFVDRRESALNESGDILLAIRDGAIDADHIAGELGEALIGQLPGRTDRQQVTLFKSLGLAVEDVAAARAVVEAAQEAGAGTTVRLA